MNHYGRVGEVGGDPQKFFETYKFYGNLYKSFTMLPLPAAPPIQGHLLVYATDYGPQRCTKGSII